MEIVKPNKAGNSKSDKSVEKLKVPPHSIEAEQSVLGSMLIDPESWDKVAERVVEDDFYNRSHRIIYSAILKLLAANQPVDLLTVTDQLSNHDQLEEAGGFAYVAELGKNTPSSANVIAYAEIIRERAVTRELIGVAHDIADVGYNPEGRDSTQILDLAESKVFEIAEKRTTSNEGPQGVEAVLGKTIDRLETLLKTNKEVTGVSTGFTDLDKKTSGLQPSDLIIVAARPSMGKCIVAGSRIADPESGALKSIDDLVANKQATLLSVTDDFKLKPTEATDFVDDGVKPVFKVRTALGREISTTLSHPFLTSEGWLPLEKVKVGDRVGVPRALPIFGNARWPEFQIKVLAYMLGDGDTTQTSPRFTNSNETILAEFAQSVAEFGAVHSVLIEDEQRTPSLRVVSEPEQLAKNRQQFATTLDKLIGAADFTAEALAQQLNVSKSLISAWRHGHCVPGERLLNPLADAFSMPVEQLFPLSYGQAAKNAPNPVSKWLDEQGVRYKQAHEKFVPQAVFTLEKPLIALFLNRLFACDGSMFVQANNQVRASFSSSSKQLARDVQHLLLRFGIIAKLRVKINAMDADGHTPYEVEIMDQQSLLRFIDEIGIFSKQQRVAEAHAVLQHKASHSNLDSMPESVCDYILAVKGERSWSQLHADAGVDCPQGYNPHLSGQSRRLVSRKRCAEFARLLNDDYLRHLSESDIYWDEVVAIESIGEQQVYDLTVADYHNFVAEDFCVHNTTFAMNLCENAMLLEEKPVLVFSLEMPSEQIMMRMLASLSRVDQTKIRTAQLDDEDWARISNTMAMLKDKDNLYVDDSSGLTPMEVRTRARKLARERGGISMIMVDYLQLMQVPALSDNRTLEIAEISRSLKALAKELEVPVVALSQLNRSLEQRADKRPVNSDLRESGSIEQDADLIMFIYRDEVYHENSEYKGVAEIIIGKQRNGPIGTSRLTFQGQFSRFDNYAGPAFDDEY